MLIGWLVGTACFVLCGWGLMALYKYVIRWRSDMDYREDDR